MIKNIYRVFVEKKPNYNVEGKKILEDLNVNLGIEGLNSLRIINRYDVSGISEKEYKNSRNTIFSEPTVDYVYDEELVIKENQWAFAIEYLPGQYDQRADSAAQCIQMLTQGERPEVAAAKVIVLQGEISKVEFQKIKEYCINSVDSREASMEKPDNLYVEIKEPQDVKVLDGFIDMDDRQLQCFMSEHGFAMNFEDLKFCTTYFKEIEKRNPTITEIKVIDTYWSDHCRHTTFNTNIKNVKIEDGKYSIPIKKAYEDYLKVRSFVYAEKHKDLCLMDLAVIGMKELRKNGKLADLDVSEEINACSIVVDAEINNKTEKWLIMFKNETHNHPTEIEPFGGAATCLGGAIRDPLSGRSYVYQAMRVTGSGDPRTKVEDTIKGKLPQRKITLEAAQGYSSYGNQIGLATGHVSEIYDEGYTAKRMEVGAVIAAAPYDNVVREVPAPTDLIILLGGRTGRDGCGGATGSSKAHKEDSILVSGAEVQKGNPITERKIQRLFRNSEVTTMIKRCNDFGAGGVAVAIGELAEGLSIDLDKVPKKYEGLDGTELAISESQERMAVVVDKKNVEKFIAYAENENLEAVVVAEVTEEKRLTMKWKGKTIVSLSREFLDTNGVKQNIDVKVACPTDENYFEGLLKAKLENKKSIKELWISNLENLNVCSQKGLVERFDSTIGTGTVIMPFGGKYQRTPSEAMVAKLPVLSGDTTTGTIMSYGYNPKLSTWSPFHGAMYAVIESVAKVVASGGDYTKIRLTFQEYFERLGKDPYKWGKPFSALLGALYAQREFGIPAIGGKDSMSGTFNELNVPPTLVSFAVDVVDVNKVISPEFKKTNSVVVLISAKRGEDGIPNLEELKGNYELINNMIASGKVLSAHTIRQGGLVEAISKMSFGNKIGFRFIDKISMEALFDADYGSIALEIDENVDITECFEGINSKIIGYTQVSPVIDVHGVDINIDEALKAWESPLEKVFATTVKNAEEKEDIKSCDEESKQSVSSIKSPCIKISKPRIFIPVFPGTNCEYDSKKAFEKAGAIVETLVIKNLSPRHIEESIESIVKEISRSQIVMLPGGFSAGDEPDGSGKFIATAFRNARVQEALSSLLKNRDGLMLGICNGFQALIKLGLVPFGEIREIDENSPTLTYNEIGRHVSCMVQTKVVSTLSPWLNNLKIGDTHAIPVSHGEGRFVASEEVIKKLFASGQVATQYVDFNGRPSYDINFNPNGSMYAIEGITSADGRVFGKMGHSERVGANIGKNIIGEKDQKIFEAGVNYFK
jgi:phosphoribosylformylglycinamidine synthase